MLQLLVIGYNSTVARRPARRPKDTRQAPADLSRCSDAHPKCVLRLVNARRTFVLGVKTRLSDLPVAVRCLSNEFPTQLTAGADGYQSFGVAQR